MKRVYQAANSIEAHMIVHVLEQAGVHAHVQGEHLQSGAGELPRRRSRGSRSADEDVEAAQVVREWEARSLTASAAAPKKHATACRVPVGAAERRIVWALTRSANVGTRPQRRRRRSIEKFFYDGGRLASQSKRTGISIGRIDLILEYDLHGDSNGVIAATTISTASLRTAITRRFPQMDSREAGRRTGDGDFGQPDVRSVYEHGVIAEIRAT